jgi:hypothetical protein
MSTTLQTSRTASTRRMVLATAGTFIVVLMAAAVALWAQLGTVVFFELIAAGIRYCF